jgi:hypothetical protein
MTMKKSLLLLLAGLLALPAFAQVEGDISIPEFRQALVDFAMSMDASRGPDLARTVQGLPDATLLKWYQGVPNGRRFQAAVAGFRARRQAARSLPGRPGGPSVIAAAPAARRLARTPATMASGVSSGFSSTGIAAAVPPDFSLVSPDYPSGSHWQDMVNTISGVGALDPGPQNQAFCTFDNNATMSQLVSAFHGIKDYAEAVCNVIPDPVVIILGEGTRIPAKEICFLATLIIGGFNSAAEGYLADCEGQTSMVNDSFNGATNANLPQLYNLEFRLTVEDNLQNTTAAMGMFELPVLKGGYLEYARAIVKDTIDKMTAVGLNMTSATNTMLAGDAYYNAATPNYKLAYKQYQRAYASAVQ